MTIDQNNAFNVDELHHEVLMQLEAIIFASDAPVSLARLKEAFQNQYSKQQLQQYLQQLSVLQHGRSIELVETAQGYRFQVRAKYRNVIAQVWPDRPTRLSPSLLETVAVIAYHQPVTRADIEQIRGVTNNSQILRTLFDWNWIKESGYRELPGRPRVVSDNATIFKCFWSSVFRSIASPTGCQGSFYDFGCASCQVLNRCTVDDYF